MLTARQVAEKLNCSKFFVYKHYKELGGFKIGRLTRFDPDDLDRKLEEVRDGTTETPRGVEI
jgi:excisionase family DNA binding protein